MRSQMAAAVVAPIHAKMWMNFNLQKCTHINQNEPYPPTPAYIDVYEVYRTKSKHDALYNGLRTPLPLMAEEKTRQIQWHHNTKTRLNDAVMCAVQSMVQFLPRSYRTYVFFRLLFWLFCLFCVIRT